MYCQPHRMGHGQHLKLRMDMDMGIYIYMYIYIYVCVCVQQTLHVGVGVIPEYEEYISFYQSLYRMHSTIN